MTEPHDWQAILRANAAAYADIALVNIEREFPADAWHTWHDPADAPPRPRERTPVFWGSYDWHSSVEMYWLLVRLARLVPGEIPLSEVRADARPPADTGGAGRRGCLHRPSRQPQPRATVRLGLGPGAPGRARAVG